MQFTVNYSTAEKQLSPFFKCQFLPLEWQKGLKWYSFHPCIPQFIVCVLAILPNPFEILSHIGVSFNLSRQCVRNKDSNHSFIVTPALAVCDKVSGFSSVDPSVHLSVHNLLRPWLLNPFKLLFLLKHCIYESQISHAAWSDCRTLDL